MRTGLFQIRAAVDQFWTEHPERIFVRYGDIIGPNRYLRAPLQAYGEDYHQVFPRRCDETELVLTYPDGKRLVLLSGLLQAADGTFLRYSARAGQINQPGQIARYQRELTEARKPDGRHMQVLSAPPEIAGRKFEITYRGGRPDGPFRAYYADGAVWGEANYRQGVVVGPHRVFDRNGRVIFATEFTGGKP